MALSLLACLGGSLATASAHAGSCAVSYGVGTNLAQLKKDKAAVGRQLGPGVARSLRIEQRSGGRHALVYRRKGDCQSTARVAARHDRLLARLGIDAALTRSAPGRTVASRSRPASAKRAAAQPSVGRKLSIVRAAPAATASLHGPRPKPTVETPLDAGRPKRRGTELGALINQHIKSLRRRGQVASDESTSWLVYDLEADATVAEINGSTPRQCASMVKPFVMLAMLHEVDVGRLIYGPKLRSWTEAMIQRSDNAATNRIMRLMGGPARVQRILERHHDKLFAELSIVEYIAPGGKTYRNKASARDHARFLRSLWFGELPHSDEMRRMMGLPGRDRLQSGVATFPRGTAVLNKTGTTARLIGDMGILSVPQGRDDTLRYIMVGLIEKDRRASGFTNWSRQRANVIRGVSELSLKHLKGSHHG